MASGSRTFSSAVSVGSRLNCWKTKPTRSRRRAVSCLSVIPVSDASPTTTSPLSALSRPARQCISVDLPEPDGPITAVKRLFSKDRVTPSRAVTAVSPLP